MSVRPEKILALQFKYLGDAVFITPALRAVLTDMVGTVNKVRGRGPFCGPLRAGGPYEGLRAVGPRVGIGFHSIGYAFPGTTVAGDWRQPHGDV